MYQADEKRYETMKYHRCGASGLMLPELSLGLWHNFGAGGTESATFGSEGQICACLHGSGHYD